MFRNIYYDKKASLIHLWTWDEHGNRIYKTDHFVPYLYTHATKEKDIHAIGIDDAPLTKREFNNAWDRDKFANSYKGKLYFNLIPTQQYLLENFYKKDIQELTKNPLRIFFYDIEVIASEFPDPAVAKFPITSITIYDSLEKKFFIWGINPYNAYSCKDHLTGIEPEEIVYEYCVTETQLLKKFLRYWRANFPDLVCGYNSDSFDMPYIVNRLESVFGPGKSSDLSPVDKIYGVEKVNAKFGKTYTKYTIEGVSQLDYMILYKTFTPGERESDSLDFVCMGELGVGKLDYGDSSLHDLCYKDWNKFINYNIWDVKLLILLDERKKYLDVAKFTAFGGFCNIEKALGKVAALTGWLAKQSLEKGRIISTQTDGIKKDIPGGYVKEIEPGLYDTVVSLDVNSLYPSIIITLNLSPETKRAAYRVDGDEKYIYYFKERAKVPVNGTEVGDILKKHGWSISASGIMFDQSKKSVCAEFTDELYAKRKFFKNKMLALETQYKELPKDSEDYKRLEKEAAQCDTYQYLYKILLNSLYGALANRFFPLYDIDCAKSITTTGRAMIKTSEKILNNFIEKQYDLEPADRVCGMDTDSVAKDSIIRSSVGSVPVEQLWDIMASSNKIISHKNQEIIIPNNSLEVMTYVENTKSAELKPIKYIYRHKVSKKKYRLKTKDREVFVTGDHSCMVIRDGLLREMKACDIKLTDKLIHIQPVTSLTEIVDIESIEEVDSFEDEYVYDIAMGDDTNHTFFANDILVHNSAYLTLEDLINKQNIEILDEKGYLSSDFKKVINEITDAVNSEIKVWAKEKLHSKDPRFEFKRESVCPKAIWIKKKHYILHIVDKEGVKMNKTKYSGLMVAKSTFSKNVKNLTKEMVENLMQYKDKKRVDALFYESYEKFKKMPVEDIAERASIKILNKWEDKNDGLNTATGTTYAAKYVIYYNELLKQLNLTNKYKKIENGSKIKIIKVQPNRYNIEGIAFQDTIPPEFDLIPDYEKAFFKGVVNCASPIYQAIGWQIPDPNKEYTVTLDELFG